MSRKGGNEAISFAIVGVVKMEIPLPLLNVVSVYTHNLLPVDLRTLEVQIGGYDHGPELSVSFLLGVGNWPTKTTDG